MMAQAGMLDLAQPKAPEQQKAESKKSFADMVRSKVSTVLVGKKQDQFVTDLVNLINQDPALYKCDPLSLTGAALQAQGLNLALNKAMGQAWIIPFNDNKNNRTLATFVIGYKGYLQLAMRSGYYRKINVIAVKKGELKRYDPLNEDLEVDLIQDVMERHEAPAIGYYAMFEYLNGFRKCMYWPKELMLIHADRYSPAFSLKATTVKTRYGQKQKVSYADFAAGAYDQRDAWMYSSFWYKDFDVMAYKTMLRQILTKWGIMSVEMQQAHDLDSRIFQENGDMGGFADGDFDEESGGNGQRVFDTEAMEPDSPPEGVQTPAQDGSTAEQPATKSRDAQRQPRQAAKNSPKAHASTTINHNAPYEDDDGPPEQGASPSAIGGKEIECANHPGTTVRTDVECQTCASREGNCGYWHTGGK